MRLISGERALTAILEAGRLERPFRVALPTYAYVVGLQEVGRVAGVRASATPGRFRAGIQQQRVGADPLELGQFLVRLRDQAPTTLRGVIWFRLPVAGESLNWSWLLPQLAASVEARQLVTIYLLSRPWSLKRYARPWLSALDRAAATEVAGAEYIAWLSYREGDYDSAAGWLKLVPPGTDSHSNAIAEWIGARLAIDNGQQAAAVAHLSRVVAAFPVDDSRGEQVMFWDGLSGWETESARRARAELALLEINRRIRSATCSGTRASRCGCGSCSVAGWRAWAAMTRPGSTSTGRRPAMCCSCSSISRGPSPSGASTRRAPRPTGRRRCSYDAWGWR